MGPVPLLRFARAVPFIERVFADSAYAGEQVAGQIGFQVHERRRAVERFSAWIGRNRRFSRLMPLGVRRSATSPDMRGAKPCRSTLGPHHPGVFHAVLILAFLILRTAQVMSDDDHPELDFDPLDDTKRWPEDKQTAAREPRMAKKPDTLGLPSVRRLRGIGGALPV